MEYFLSALYEKTEQKLYTEVKKKNILFSPLKVLSYEKNSNFLRTQYQILIVNRIGKTQKVVQNGKYEIEVKPFPQKKIGQKIEQPDIDVKCPDCKQRKKIKKMQDIFFKF